MSTHYGGLIQREEGLHGSIRVTRDLKAVLLSDGQWYPVEDPTLPDGPDGYLSFLQPHGDQVAMVNVQVSDIKGASYFHMPLGFHG